MITLKHISAHQSSITSPWPDGEWSSELALAARDAHSLLRAVAVDPEQLSEPLDPSPSFPVLAPPSFINRMQAGDPNDPLLKQVLPILREQQPETGFVNDPLAETDPNSGFVKAPGLLQKYHGRVLLITTPACAINCRYCFRREFPYQQHRPRNHQQALDAIAADASVTEVILSGGDPLLLSDEHLLRLLNAINEIPHVQRIRIHSRIPIVLPQRITQGLLDALNQRCQMIMVVHSNHPQELNSQTQRAMACLQQAQLMLLNQSVLLRGINDSATVLSALSTKSFTQGVLPYYLHLPDHVAGTQHFFVSDDEGRAIFAKLQKILPGYLLPRLVREHSGAESKTLMNE